MLMAPEIQRHIVWSTDHVDPSDPFQRRWLLRQVLTHGLAADIRALDFDEIERELDELYLSPEIDSLWRMYLKQRHQDTLKGSRNRRLGLRSSETQ
jgi:hypothetical protein